MGRVEGVIVKDMRQWYETRLEGEPTGKVLQQLRSLLFRTVKQPVPYDLWFPRDGASQPADGEDEEAVEVVVSETWAGLQLRNTVLTRDRWLASQGLDLDTKMNPAQRENFLRYARDEYEAEARQLQLQAKDQAQALNLKLHGRAYNNFIKGRKRSRWNREQQRRCGSHQFWQIVSFGGISLGGQQLCESLEAALKMKEDDASQPAPDSDNDAERKRRYKMEALQARADYRYAQSVARKKNRISSGESIGTLTHSEQQALDFLESGWLRTRANDTTVKHGHGTVRYPDGRTDMIGANTGGITRRVLDKFVPLRAEDLEL